MGLVTLHNPSVHNCLFAQDLNFIRPSPHRYIPFYFFVGISLWQIKAKLVTIYYYSYSGSYVEGLIFSVFFQQWMMWHLCNIWTLWCILYLPQDHVLQQTTPSVVDMLEVVTVICYVTFIETAVLMLPRPVSHVSSQSLWLRTVKP